MRNFYVLLLSLLMLSCGSSDEKTVVDGERMWWEEEVIEGNEKEYNYYSRLIKEDPFYEDVYRRYFAVNPETKESAKGDLYKIYERKVIIDGVVEKRDGNVEYQYFVKNVDFYSIYVFKLFSDIYEISDATHISRNVFSSNEMTVSTFIAKDKKFSKDNMGKVKTDFYNENGVQYFKYITEDANETEIITILDLGPKRKF